MQKTAYELRISDWSSDVCSSDLHALFSLPGVYCTDRSVCSLHHDSVGQWVVCDTHGQALASAPNVVLANAWQDRKSVVWGKSVSVRVDIGGRRIIKKTINS